MNKNKYLFPIALLMASVVFVHAQTKEAATTAAPATPPPPPAEQKVTVYGFVRNDVYFNSRRNLDLRDGVLDLYPLDKSVPAAGSPIDINAVGQIGFSAIVSRLGVKFAGVKAFNADVSGVLEADFFGITNSATNISAATASATPGAGTENLLRLRHAYAQLDWKKGTNKTSLLIGQYWNPNFIAKNFPGTANFNTGIPFNPFGFVPQVRVTRTWNKLSLAGMAYGYDLAGFSPSISGSNIPNGVDAFKLSGIPALAAQLSYENSKLLVLGGVEVNSIVPNVAFTATTRTASTYTAVNTMITAKYTAPSVVVKAYANYGGLYTQYVGLGGFVGYRDSTNGNFKYVSQKQLNTWFEVIVTKSKFIQPALFIGYAKNLGLANDVNTADYKKRSYLVYGRAVSTGRSYDNLVRIAPRVDFLSGKMKFSVEYEMTSILFGNTDLTNLKIKANSTANPTFSATNNRISLLMVYNF